MNAGVGDVVGIGVLLLFVLLLLAYSTLLRRQTPALREIAGFRNLEQAIERSVESGARVHLSLGSGSLVGPQAGPALVGLSVLRRIAERGMLGLPPA